MDGQYYNLWSTDNDKTVHNDDLVIKSVYDPSPVGFSLPASNAFTGFTTTGNYSQTLSEYNVKGNFDKGKYFYTKPNKQGNTVFLPAAGWRYDYTGSLLHVATYGLYWVAGPTSRIFGRYLSFSSGDIHPLNVTYRSYGFPVRSAEERETHKFNIKLEMDGRYYNLWSTDNDKTDANDEVVIKSVYDPSPVGYSLPASNAFTGFTTTGGDVGTWNTPLTPEQRAKLNVKGVFDKGWYFYTKPDKQHTTFFPASGSRDFNPGTLHDVTTVGRYWVAGPNYRNYGRFFSFYSGDVHPLNVTDRSYGLSLRSAEERATHKFNTKLEMDDRYYNLWSTDNDRTDANDVVIKSVYDPSPVGFSLPASNAFRGFTTTGNGTNNSSEFNVKGNFYKGYYFYTKPNKQGGSIFFPASGCRVSNTGSLGSVTTYGFYWVAGPDNRNGGRCLGFYSDYVNPLSYNGRSYGFSVRSAEEKIIMVWLR